MHEKIKQLLTNFCIVGTVTDVRPVGNGNINDTYKVKTKDKDGKTHRYAVQAINPNVFKNARAVMENIQKVTNHIKIKIIREGGDPSRQVLEVIPTFDGQVMYVGDDNVYWRVYTFIHKASTYDLVTDPVQLYNAGVAFGKFQQRLADFPAEELYITIPDFHNTKKRFEYFLEVVAADPCGRVSEVKEEIDLIIAHKSIITHISDMLDKGELVERVTHNDTKFNNVMIDDQTNEGICVIDLDTVMPGLSLHDFGDAIRFAASSAEEDEKDLDKVWLRLDMYENFTRGFMEQIKGTLPKKELENMNNGVLVITLELAMRFLTDYLNGDTYFKTKYKGHNLVRARCQLHLLKDMEKKLPQMNEILAKYI